MHKSMITQNAILTGRELVAWWIVSDVRIRGLHARVRLHVHTLKVYGGDNNVNIRERLEPLKIRIVCRLS